MNRLVSLARKLPRISREHVLCGAMLGVLGANLLSNAALRSLTYDEFVQIAVDPEGLPDMI